MNPDALPPDTFTVADVIAVLAYEDLSAATTAATAYDVVPDLALVRQGELLLQRARLIRSSRFTDRAGEAVALGAARHLSRRAPASPRIRVQVGERDGEALYCWVALRVLNRPGPRRQRPL